MEKQLLLRETEINLKQTTSHICMVRPANFGYNEQTGEDNAFQHKNIKRSGKEIREGAVKEFDVFVDILTRAGVNVTVFEDTSTPIKPDAVFPNNWITFHPDHTIITYPMYAPVRRLERRKDIVDYFLKRNAQTQHIELSDYETVDVFLEGTGSMVLDRVNKVLYACESHRTHAGFLERYAEYFGWRPIIFKASDTTQTPIYHTNVMMAIGNSWVVICDEVIDEKTDRKIVLETLRSYQHEMVSITYEQLMAFAGNILQVNSIDGTPYIVLSQRAYESLHQKQIHTLERYGALLVIPLDFIETYGGGGVRCMMAEVFGDYGV